MKLKMKEREEKLIKAPVKSVMQYDMFDKDIENKNFNRIVIDQLDSNRANAAQNKRG